MNAGEVLWSLLTGAGGTLALTLIVAMAVGINALTLLFVGSAVVTLDRFARAARRVASMLVCGLAWTVLVGIGSFYWADSQQLAQLGPWRFWALSSLGGAASIGLAMLLVWALLRFVPSRGLGSVTLATLGLGFSLVVGASGRVVYAASPLAVAVCVALLLVWRRRRRRPDAARGGAERMLWLLAGSLLAGAAIGLASSTAGPKPAVASVGAFALGCVAALVLLGLVPLAAAGLADTRGRAEWFIAVRYLVAKRRQTFISIITGICVLGIAAGVWLIITVLSVMNGFERTWREEIIGNRAHLSVQHGFGPFADYEQVLQTVESVPGVVAASPYLDAEGMVRGSGGEIMPVRVRGVDPERVGKVTDLEEDILTPGALDLLAEPATGEVDDGVPGIIVGSQLAASLGVSPGDLLTLVSPFGGPQTPLGPAPRLKRFRVAGIFRSSFFQYDEIYTYVSLPAARDFRRADDVIDGIEVRTPDFYRSRAVGRAIQQALGFPFFTRDWKEFFPAFFQALKSERMMMLVLLSMIMVVAAFAIVSTLVMMIMEKESDIAILKAMGAEDEMIERIFAIEGTLIGLVGTAIGVLAALSVTARIDWIQRQIEAVTGIDTLPAEIYQFSTLPAQLDAGQIVVTMAMAMILALGATLLPSRQGARLDPVESLRYE